MNCNLASSLMHLLAIMLLPSLLFQNGLSRKIIIYETSNPASISTPSEQEKASQAALYQPSNSDWLTAIQEHIRQSEYQVTWQERSVLQGAPAAYQAPNRRQNLRTYFLSSGPRLVRRTEANPSWQLGFTLTGLGYGTGLQPPGVAWLVAEDNRLEYRRGSLIEWYRNDEQGLEQGFTLSQPPTTGDPSNPLTLRLDLSGDLRVELAPNGQSAAFLTASSQPLLSYTGLKAWDAAGRALPIWLEAQEEALLLRLSDQGALYPLNIDPLISTTADWSFTFDPPVLLDDVSSAGDVNGDGHSDIIIGAESYDHGQNSEGGAFVFYGSSSGPGTSYNWSAEGDQAEMYFGTSVAGAGDVNGDGYDDVLIGALGYSNTQNREGAIFLYYGSAGGLGSNGTPNNADWRAESDSEMAYLGLSCHAAGDVNGDGYADVVVGAPWWQVSGVLFGRAFVWYGSPSGLGPNGNPSNADWQDGPTSGSQQLFGISVSAAGDVDHDGYDDLLVGASDANTAYLYSGSTSGLSTTPVWSATVHQTYQYGIQFGSNVSGAGDVNSDGYDDILVSAPAAYKGDVSPWPTDLSAGKVYAWFGSESGLGDPGTAANADWIFNEILGQSQQGVYLDAAGDVDGDGFDDILVGSPYYGYNEDRGSGYLFYGSASGLPANASQSWYGTESNAWFGAIAGVGDVNGDGFPDIAIGAHNLYRVSLYFGHPSPSTPSAKPDLLLQETQTYASYGKALTSMGDANNDGYDDIVVGSPRYDNGQDDEGRVWVYFGSSTGVLTSTAWYTESNRAASLFGATVSGAGDVNNDGYDDLLVGSSEYANGQYNEGAAWLFYGASGNALSASGWFTESNLVAGYLGFDLASAGDVNNDGFDDVVVGAPSYYDTFAYLYNGSDSGLPVTPSWRVQGYGNSGLGTAVDGGCDFNHDSYDDLLVSQNGAVYLWYGSASGLGGDGTQYGSSWYTYEEQSNSLFGASAGFAGDINGDDICDIYVGAPRYDKTSPPTKTDIGKAYIYYGASGTPDNNPDSSVMGDGYSTNFGLYASCDGDLDGDGYADLAVSASDASYKYGGEGRVFIYYGSGSGLGTTPVWQVGSDQQGAYTGLGMGHPGDFNNDGYDDLPVGAFGINTAYVYYGRALIGSLDAENSGPTELNQATYFTATLMGGEGGSVSYTWDFGDGTTASGVQVQHTYSTPGAFLVRVTADNNISHAHAETTVTVFQPFTLEPGGNFATGDGLLSFTAPSGLSSSLVITYTPQSTLTHSSGVFQFAGLSFGLTVTDLSGNPVIVPNQPLTLVISYNEADLPPGMDENLLQLYRYNPGTSAWVAMIVLSRNTTANTLAVRLDHFSEFALMQTSISNIYLPLVRK